LRLRRKSGITQRPGALFSFYTHDSTTW
jgi:hypothetical protein